MTDPLRDYPVIIPLPVQWGEMDAFNHLNNIMYFRYFEGARIAYFTRMEILEDVAAGIGPILASTSCRFKAPLSYPDSVRVGARVSEVDEDRFTMKYAVLSEKLGRIAAEGEGIIVSFDYGAGQKVSLPDRWRNKIHEIQD